MEPVDGPLMRAREGAELGIFGQKVGVVGIEGQGARIFALRQRKLALVLVQEG